MRRCPLSSDVRSRCCRNRKPEKFKLPRGSWILSPRAPPCPDVLLIKDSELRRCSPECPWRSCAPPLIPQIKALKLPQSNFCHPTMPPILGTTSMHLAAVRQLLGNKYCDPLVWCLKTSVASYTGKKNAIQILYISNNKRTGFTSLKQRLIGYDDHFN